MAITGIHKVSYKELLWYFTNDVKRQPNAKDIEKSTFSLCRRLWGISFTAFVSWVRDMAGSILAICKSNLAHFQNFEGKCNQNPFFSASHLVIEVRIFFHFLHL